MRVLKSIEWKIEENVLLIIMNKPKSLNALDDDIKSDLNELFNEAHENEEVKVVVITGSGRAFSAGGDLNSLEKIGQAIEGRDRIKKLHLLVKKMVDLEKPIIAAVNGFAVGAGFNLALASDIIIASEDAKFSQIFSKVGLIPDAGGLYFLPRLVGPHRAKELVFTGKMIDANEALRIGIVNKVVKNEDLLTESQILAKQLARGPSKAIAFSKKIINKSLEWDLETLLETEAFAQGVCMNSHDFKEGVKAFKEKREPNFRGE